MSKTTLFRIFKQITPPFIFNFIKKSKYYNIFKRTLGKIFRSEYNPKWNIITGGILKGREIFFDPKENWQREMINGDYDDFIFDHLEEIDLKKSLIFDIGAHIGFHSLVFAVLVGREGQVWSFEPNSANVARLKKILVHNSDLGEIIKIHQTAVSNRDGQDHFFSSENIEGGTSSGGFIDSSDTFRQRSDYIEGIGFQKTLTKVITLDSLIELVEKEGKNPALLKIDVEGAENLVLEGGRNFIHKFKPLIMMEVHSIYNMFEVLSTLNSLSYQATLLKKEPDGRCFISAKIKKD